MTCPCYPVYQPQLLSLKRESMQGPIKLIDLVSNKCELSILKCPTRH
jgi:hypothetical protein